MFNVTAFDTFGMVFAAVALIGLALWAQRFRSHPSDIIGKRNTFFAVSALFLVVSVVSIGFKGFRWGMDFTGGTIVEVGFVEHQDSLQQDQIRQVIMDLSTEKDLKLLEPQVQLEENTTVSAEHPYRKVIIRISREGNKSISTDEVQSVADRLESKLGRLYRQGEKAEAAPTSGLGKDEKPAKKDEQPSKDAKASADKPEAKDEKSAQDDKSAKDDKTSADKSDAKDEKVAKADESAEVSKKPAGESDAKAKTEASSKIDAEASPKGSGATTKEADKKPASKDSETAASTAGTTLLSRESIDPVIGEELFSNALVALGVALLLQLVYITFRFGNQIRYGIAADLALLHDVVIMAGLYSLAGRQVDSPFLAAVLTVIGYSVMDSIVVFDRIRENVRVSRRGNYEAICNDSLNQTMSRSVNTTLTVLLTLCALFFFGGDTLRNFAFALLVGVTSGAYSSIFVATPLVVIFDQWAKNREDARVAERRANRAASGVREDDAPARPSREASESRGTERSRRLEQASPLTEDYPDLEDMESDDMGPRGGDQRPRRRRSTRRPRSG